MNRNHTTTRGGYLARLGFTRRGDDRRPDPAVPAAPKNASPVPWLTSLHNCQRRGPYGDPGYPGNCGGEIIKDLLNFFMPRNVFDPMEGSGTCRDVCRELGIRCFSADLRKGFDAGNPGEYPRGKFDFVWMHPPYWRQKVYSRDRRDLSTAPTLDAFLEGYARVISNCAGVLAEDGRMAILMGDYSDREEGFVPLVFWTKAICFDLGLVQPCTDIIRFSYGASSSRKEYQSSFIPGLHDVVTVVEHPREGRRTDRY